MMRAAAVLGQQSAAPAGPGITVGARSVATPMVNSIGPINIVEPAGTGDFYVYLAMSHPSGERDLATIEGAAVGANWATVASGSVLGPTTGRKRAWLLRRTTAETGGPYPVMFNSSGCYATAHSFRIDGASPTPKITNTSDNGAGSYSQTVSFGAFDIVAVGDLVLAFEHRMVTSFSPLTSIGVMADAVGLPWTSDDISEATDGASRYHTSRMSHALVGASVGDIDAVTSVTWAPGMNYLTLGAILEAP